MLSLLSFSLHHTFSLLTVFGTLGQSVYQTVLNHYLARAALTNNSLTASLDGVTLTFNKGVKNRLLVNFSLMRTVRSKQSDFKHEAAKTFVSSDFMETQ